MVNLKAGRSSGGVCHECLPDSITAVEEADELSVLLDLDIDAQPEAQVTILTDPENNANLVGSTEGNIHLTLEDWERMTLTGTLTVVEGRCYDFALDPCSASSSV